MAETAVRRHIFIKGVVQGVGFRPFIFQLAREHALNGWVLNSSSGVRIEVEGSPRAVDAFIEEIPRKVPPLARLESVDVREAAPEGAEAFVIKQSLEEQGEFMLVSPDIATCDDCVEELLDPNDRRYRYPFINCTNCGPRFTIIEDIPYDRPKTTMKNFPMCPVCRREYEDPSNRRFHAQPNACPVCGPALELRIRSGGGFAPEAGDPVDKTIELLSAGKIVALKGLGGFHLACDAMNESAVAELRKRKHRYGKPLALMVADIEAARELCEVSGEEAGLLESPERPIVLLELRSGSVAPSVAPGVGTLGIMLPYTPLHHVLLKESGLVLVMTSGNLSEEPIAMDNEEAIARLSEIADAFLLNNRDIYSRYDDSVSRVVKGERAFIRRARGYAPFPVKLPFKTRQLLAAGPEQKNTFCLTKDEYAFVSQHIGDLENLETLVHFERTLELYKKLFRIEPEAVAYDLHPEYLSTKFAQELALPKIGVQHHHAHTAGCMVENGVLDEVIGVSFDGTGYGTDGKIWGGEFLLATPKEFKRVGHLAYARMPGGAEAVKKPYRMAVGYLHKIYGSGMTKASIPLIERIPQAELRTLVHQIERGLNSPETSSSGRLFDAAAALAGVMDVVLYEGQAAIEFEMLATDAEGSYPFQVEDRDGVFIADTSSIIEAVVEDVVKGTPAPVISRRFHRSVADLILRVCGLIRASVGNNTVALSGGVFQNALLFGEVVERLRADRFDVIYHRLVPANDGGVSLGQAIVANARLED
ncbi:MAG: carbamoyltransferase HypF [Candidatus Aquicultorales bacterium]